MRTSTNYGLKLMEGTDNVKRQDFVDNFTKIDTEMKNIDNKHSAYGTTSGTNTYTVSITGITSLYDGLRVTIKIGTASTGASTLNINGLGAKTILDNLGNAITSGGLKAGIPYNLCYNGTNFIVLGKGGGGNATADKILNGYKATVDSGQVTGTMANNGAISGSLNAGQSKVIPKGYTDGGTITANSLASQTQASATVAQILAGYSAWVNGVLLNGGMVNRGAVSATLNAGGSYTIPAGYHNGSGKVTANSLASQGATKFARGSAKPYFYDGGSGKGWYIKIDAPFTPTAVFGFYDYNYISGVPAEFVSLSTSLTGRSSYYVAYLYGRNSSLRSKVCSTYDMTNIMIILGEENYTSFANYTAYWYAIG